ncbi:MAG: hypothetical protein ACE5JL_04550, partial [Dehalococcoidia bacterium]
DANFLIIFEEPGSSSLAIGNVNAGITLDKEERLVWIKSQGDVAIESMGKITIQGAQVEIKSDANMDIEAGAMMNTKAEANFTIRGAIVQIN